MVKDPNTESHVRSILKAVTWRLIATGTTFILSYTVFSNTGCENVLEKASIVAGLELFLKLALYYGHERIWQSVPRGSVRHWFEKKK